MDDRTLLTLAAKAAGIWDASDPSNGMLKATGQYWNPLTDDGDALRLAVKLGICIYTNIVHAYVKLEDDTEITAAEEPTGDRCAAIRRAITRAAAEIGRSMK